MDGRVAREEGEGGGGGIKGLGPEAAGNGVWRSGRAGGGQRGKGWKAGVIKIWNIDMADTEDGAARLAHHGGRGAVGQARRRRP